MANNKTPKAKLWAKMLKLAKKIVYIRDQYKCQHCGKQDFKDYQASHVIPISADRRLQYDILNMKVLCHHCHLNRWHKNPLESWAWFSEVFPDREEYLIDRHADNRWKWTIDIKWMEDLYDSYIELYESIKHNDIGEKIKKS